MEPDLVVNRLTYESKVINPYMIMVDIKPTDHSCRMDIIPHFKHKCASISTIIIAIFIIMAFIV